MDEWLLSWRASEDYRGEIIETFSLCIKEATQFLWMTTLLLFWGLGWKPIYNGSITWQCYVLLRVHLPFVTSSYGMGLSIFLTPFKALTYFFVTCSAALIISPSRSTLLHVCPHHRLLSDYQFVYLGWHGVGTESQKEFIVMECGPCHLFLLFRLFYIIL